MSEIRKNIATKDWVVVPREHLQPPQDFIQKKARKSLVNPQDCPFCPGNESRTLPETLAYRAMGTIPNEKGWWIRVIPHMNPLLNSMGELKREETADIFIQYSGVGHHENVIESPNHNEMLGFMDARQTEEVFLAYRERYLSLSRDSRVKMVTFFKNHGPLAGGSIEHSHSHIVAMPMVPNSTRHHLEEARRYYDDHGTCGYCDSVEAQLRYKETIVLESEGFVAFEPFASMYPFETWIVPREHKASFGQAKTDEIKHFAHVVNEVLRKIQAALSYPDYNYCIFTAPVDEQNAAHFHWHMQIFPRFETVPWGGLGIGINVNKVLPEHAAKFFREV